MARETETGELRVDLMEQARDLPTPLPACTSFVRPQRRPSEVPALMSGLEKLSSETSAPARSTPREHDALQCWSDRRQTSQQDVSEGFGVAHAIEAGNLDQLASEDGF